MSSGFIYLDKPHAVGVVFLPPWYSSTDEDDVVGGVSNDQSVSGERCRAAMVAKLSD